jgi:hypothetical protein
MSDEKFLRDKAREAIRAGNLPARPPDQVWGGPGTGARCAVCDGLTSPDETELEIEFSGGGRSGASTYYFHLRCFSMLELERENVSTEAVSARMQTRAAPAEPMTDGRGRRNGART